MTYAFDTSPLSALFKNYYPRRFPSLWRRFNKIVDDGRLVCTREVLREIEDGPIESLREWASNNDACFPTPTPAEGAFVVGIYAVAHFQQNIERQKILKGGRTGDPFIIAKAATDNLIVVTLETLRPNAVRIPNICDHFRVPWLSLETFMEAEGWQF